MMMAVMMAMVMANVLDADEAALPPAAALSGRGHVWWQIVARLRF